MFKKLMAISLSILTLASVSSTAHAQTQTKDGAAMNKTNTAPKPKVIIFDVNETLLDLAPLKTSVGEALGGREDLLPLWFSTMLHYSLVETLSNEFHPFGEIGTAALMMVAKNQNIDLTYDEAKTSIITPLGSLPPHADVKAGLEALSKGEYKMVSLTNSSFSGVKKQFENAGLTDFFDKRYSVEEIKKYKPHPDTYKIVLDDLGVKPEEAMMVAAHPWDLMGAKSVGLQTVFVERPGKPLYPITQEPDYTIKDLQGLVDLLAE